MSSTRDNGDVVLLPGIESERRIAKFQEMLAREECDGAVILHNVDLFYYTGTVQDSFLWLPASGEPVLVVRKHIEKARAESPLERIVAIKSVKQIPDVIAKLDLPARPRIGFEADVMPVSTWNEWRRMIPDAAWEDVSALIWRQRSVKSELERSWLRKAGRIVTESFEAIPSFFEPGMTEIELSTLIAREMRLRGHHGFIRTRGWRSEIFIEGSVTGALTAGTPWSFDGPVPVHSCYPAIGVLNSRRVIEPGRTLLVDIVGGYNGYLNDHARTYVPGRVEDLPDDLRRAHDTAVLIRDRLLEAMKPGAIPADLYAMAVGLAEEAGFAHGFMNHGKNQVRFVGHGIGLELDEGPVVAKRFTEPLEEGNVISLEPKFVFPPNDPASKEGGVGGVGVEDSVVVTPEGGEILVPAPSGIRELPA